MLRQFTVDVVEALEVVGTVRIALLDGLGRGGWGLAIMVRQPGRADMRGAHDKGAKYIGPLAQRVGSGVRHDDHAALGGGFQDRLADQGAQFIAARRHGNGVGDVGAAITHQVAAAADVLQQPGEERLALLHAGHLRGFELLPLCCAGDDFLVDTAKPEFLRDQGRHFIGPGAYGPGHADHTCAHFSPPAGYTRCAHSTMNC